MIDPLITGTPLSALTDLSIWLQLAYQHAKVAEDHGFSSGY